MIDDAYHGPVPPKAHIDPDRRRTVPFSIIEQIANHPPQQGTIARGDNGNTGDGTVLVASRLLRRERKQVDVLCRLDALCRLEPAEEQDLFNEAVKLGDIFLERRFARWVSTTL
jgi:hypothetical protein